MAAKCSKCILVIVNILFTLIGIAFLAGGGFILGGKQYYNNQLEDLQEKIPDIASGAGLANVEEDDDDSVDFDLAGFLENMGIALIILGTFIFITGILGMCGACCMKKWMLILYMIIIIVIFIAQIAVLGAIASGMFDDDIKEEMKKIVTDKYKGIDDFRVSSLSMTYVMLEYECCGVDGYEDFNDTQWNNNRSLTFSNVTAYQTLVTPIACCKTTGNFPKLTVKNETCAIEPTDEISNWDKGCFKELKNEVDEQAVIFYAGFGALLAFELICLILAGCVLKHGDRDKDEYA